jgi:hypothetical protein
MATIMIRLLMLLTYCASVWGKTDEPNMNGFYRLSVTPNSNLSLFPQQYRDYPGGVEYFDVYSPPITTLYSQVYWKMMTPVSLPPEIIARFTNRGMAVVGFEFDQVRKTKGGDISVPMNVAYNHHFETTMTGKYSRMEKIKARHKDFTNMGHSHPDQGYIMEAIDLIPNPVIPTSQSFGAGNGGEARKSFHGYAPGFAQIINSPQTLYITPMQIDTWNRDWMNLTGSPFVPGLLPRHSLAPPDAVYSGLLECPMTTRITKLIDTDYKRIVKQVCKHNLDIHQCFNSVKKLGLLNITIITHNVSSTAIPTGCSAILNDDTLLIYYNNKDNDIPCGQNLTAITGTVQSLLNLSMSINKTGISITITGPSGVWFGVGFNATTMSDHPWTIIIDGRGNISEYRLGNHQPGTLLNRSVSVINNTVSGNIRTVTMSINIDNPYQQFSLMDDIINIIMAVGDTVELRYHKEKTSTVINLFPINTPFCICGSIPPPFGKGRGRFIYQDGTGVGFANNCQPEPRTDLLAQKNPTCDIRTYVGGQLTCHHMWSLLDADQQIPWPDIPLTYHLKFRFWFQDYSPTVHTNVKKTTWGIASPVEYDVPQYCHNGNDGCIHRISGTFTVPNNVTLVAAHFHCHAPTCLDMTLYDNQTGAIICQEKPIYGHNNSLPFDEPGYILQPPCLWGSSRYGLTSPPDVSGKTLTIIKHSNSTYGHHGEMAWSQMFYV